MEHISESNNKHMIKINFREPSYSSYTASNHFFHTIHQFSSKILKRSFSNSRLLNILIYSTPSHPKRHKTITDRYKPAAVSRAKIIYSFTRGSRSRAYVGPTPIGASKQLIHKHDASGGRKFTTASWRARQRRRSHEISTSGAVNAVDRHGAAAHLWQLEYICIIHCVAARFC